MHKLPMWFHRLVLSAIFSVLNWLLVDWLIVELSFLKYFFVEVLLIVSLKLYTFISSRLQSETP